MKIQTRCANGTATLQLNGRFQFDAHREFRAAYDPFIADDAIRVVVLDFGQVEYLDSSALGMLLLLREKLAAVNKAVEITNSQGVVRQVLDVANFGRLFRIS